MYMSLWKLLLSILTLSTLHVHLRAASIKGFHIAKKRIQRVKRGILSKTGICPAMEVNTARRDNRLNFFGKAVVLPGDEEPNCYQSDCSMDHDCEADRKCCRNNCGALVCTAAARAPHPCEVFECPEETICKIERVRCRMPFCPDLYARSRPTCVFKPDYYAKLAKKRSKIPQAEVPHEPGPNEVHFVPKQPYGKEPVPFSY